MSQEQREKCRQALQRLRILRAIARIEGRVVDTPKLLKDYESELFEREVLVLGAPAAPGRGRSLGIILPRILVRVSLKEAERIIERIQE